jgi:hypothetical protein
MLYTWNRGDIRNAGNLMVISCQEKKSPCFISDNFRQHAYQPISRNVDAMLAKLFHQKSGALTTIINRRRCN